MKDAGIPVPDPAPSGHASTLGRASLTSDSAALKHQPESGAAHRERT
jgi:hypothetical protein